MSLVGSTEWVENRGKLLGANTVAYLNVDSGVSGNLTFSAGATPLLYSALFQATKMVKSENPGFDTVYDEWLYYSNTSYNGTLRPMVGDLGSGSDYAPFLQSHGISSSSMSFVSLTVHCMIVPQSCMSARMSMNEPGLHILGMEMHCRSQCTRRNVNCVIVQGI